MHRSLPSIPAFASKAGLSLCAVFALMSAGPAAGQTLPLKVGMARFIYDNYINAGFEDDQSAVTFYSGSVGPYVAPGGSSQSAAVPTGTMGNGAVVKLAQSGFGAPFSADVPYGNFASDTLKRARRLLYWEDAESTDERNKAAFRYKVLLYGPDTDAGPDSREERAEAAQLQETREAAALEALKATAAIEVPDQAAFIASVPGSIQLTVADKAVLEHQRQRLIRKVEYAKREVQQLQEADARRQRGIRDTAETVRNNFEDIGAYYGDAERARITEALTILRDAMKYAPLDRAIINTYLDVFYDKAVAELQFIKIAKAERARYRLGLVSLPQGKQFVIDQEIEILRDRVLPHYESTLQGLSDLLMERGGVNVSKIDPAYPKSTPLGYYLFKREQPFRNKMAASWLNGGSIEPVPHHDGTTSSSAPRVLFDGYKDYVMVLTILSDYLNDAADLARMYGMRGRVDGSGSDHARALAVIEKVQQEVYVDVRMLEAMFSEYNPEPGDASGIFAARQGILTALGEVERVRNFLAGTTNALGFDPDFLVLIKEFPDTTQGNQFDSYDALVRWIRNTDTSVYNFARTTYLAAAAAYDNYRAKADEVAAQLDDIETELSDRYFELVGTANVDDIDVTPENPAPGSELAQVNQSLSALQEKKNSLGQLTQQFTEDMQAATYYKEVIVPGKGQAIDAALSRYVSTVSKEFDIITEWSAASAGAQALFDTISNTASIAAGGDIFTKPVAAVSAGVVAGAGVVNTGIQIAASLKQGNAEKAIDKAQATYDAELQKTELESDLYQAGAELSALRREMIGNAIESINLESELAQEQARKTALLREVANIKQKANANLEALADRYYADPIHQLRSQSAEIRADNAFREAQEWVFYTIRALEYKWNKPFAIQSGGVNYDTGSILKIRNFTELENLMVAVEQFNTTNLVNFNREPFVDKLSLKYDFFGLRDDASYAITNSNGTSITVDAQTAFRKRLQDLVNQQTGVLEIPLNTFSLKKADGLFFAGPEYNNLGQITNAGKYLDKIEWMKFNVLTSAAPKVDTGGFSYGGTSYIRTQVPPCMNLSNDRELAGEFKRFPFRYFLTLDNGATWQSRPTQDDTVKIVFSNTSAEPVDSAADPVYRNTFLKERSVAATQQKLSITASKIDITKVNDIEIYVRHLLVSRELPNCN